MMKVKLNIAILLFALITNILIQGCSGPKKSEITTVSPDQKNTIIITGNKSNFADPIMVSLTVKGESVANPPIIEIYAKELNKENVLFEWKSNNDCIITFLQQDGTTRVFKALVGPGGFSIQE